MIPGRAKSRLELPWLPYPKQDQMYVINAHNFSTNQLKTNLISYWKLDEASGNAVDSHGSNTLTQFNSPGTSTGVINSSRTLNGSNQNFRIASNTSLEVGDLDWTFSGWFFLTSKPIHVIASKRVAAGRSWAIQYLTANDRYRVLFSTDNANDNIILTASNFGSPPTNTWFFCCAWHDAANNTVNVQFNNGSVNSASYSSGTFPLDSASPFVIGGFETSQYTPGRADECAFWKRVLTADERTQLYNSGAGYSYDLFQ